MRYMFRVSAKALTVMLAVVALGVVVGCGSDNSSSDSASGSGSGSTTTSGSGGGSAKLSGQCGQDVAAKPPSPDGAFDKLSPEAQKEYTYFPYPVTETPWATFKGKKPPYKLGYISQPLYGSGGWLVHILDQMKKLAAEGKAKGLVSSLETYVPPDPATATPAQQISAVQRMVRDGVDAIMILPLATDALVPAIDAAGKAGVPVIGVDSPLPGSKYGVYTWTDNNSPTYSQTMNIIGGKGNVLIVRGVAGAGAESFWYKSAVDAVKRCPGAKIVGELKGDWNNATAKTAILSFLASHPGMKIDAVLEAGGMAPGILDAFIQNGSDMPAVSIAPCTTGVLSWWLENMDKTKNSATCFDGYQTAWSNWNVALRVLAGNGPKVNGISIGLVGKTVTNDNLKDYAKPGFKLDDQDEPTGKLDGYASDEFLDQFFEKPGTPSGSQ
jgi:ribose transport system substrate-binding protein